MTRGRHVRTCPNCNGKGHVLDALGATFALMSPIGWGLLVFGNNDPDSFTRERCVRCKGTGEVRTRE